jgi:methyl-accepting chemotaxis protein
MRLNVRTKLLTGFAVVLVLTGVVGGVGLSQIDALSSSMASTYSDNVVPLSYVGDIETVVMTRARDLRNVIIFAKDEAQRNNAIAAIAADDKQVSDLLAKFEASQPSAEEKTRIAAFKAAWADYKTLADDIIRVASQGQVDAAAAKLSSAATSVAKVQSEVQSLKKFNVDAASRANTDGSQAAAQAALTMLVLVASAILLGLGIGLFLSQTISGGVRQVARAAQGLAEGDVDQTVVVKGGDEIGQMAEAIRKTIDYMRGMANVAESISNGDLTQKVSPRSDRDSLGVAFQRMIANLRETVGSVSSSATALNEASRQLSTASSQAGAATSQIATTIQEVARGNQEQSGAVQETTASVGQLTRAIDQIAKGTQEQALSIEKASTSVGQLNESVTRLSAASREVSNAAQQARLAATSGSETVKQTACGMAAIKSSTNVVAARINELDSYSEQIGTIVEAIDDIAEQTNLLALNAAIEAARAGEHGRGFAVVADEVRKLAERSSRSTKEIAGLIDQVQQGTRHAVSAMEQGAKEVESGFQLAEQAGTALKDILAAAEAAAAQAEHIASAVSQMEGATQQVVSVIDSVSTVVEESSAASQQMAASSQEVTKVIEKVAAVSEETSASAEEVSASTEEMSAQVEEVVALSEELTRMADDLKIAMASFQLQATSGARCWEVQKCSREIQAKCPAYQSGEDRCWLIPGTWCGGVLQGDAVSKRHRCMNCPAFSVIAGDQDGVAMRRRQNDWVSESVQKQSAGVRAVNAG